MSKLKKSPKKIFVLDTSVILYNHNAINSFAEHDVAIHITVLEEIDRFKIFSTQTNDVSKQKGYQ